MKTIGKETIGDTQRELRFKDIFSRVLLVNDETQMSNKYKIRNEAKRI